MRAYVTSESLRVREEPWGRIVDELAHHAAIEIADFGGDDVWAKIGEKRWACIESNGTRFVALGDPPMPSTHPDGFDAPVGTDEERTGSEVWPWRWFSALDYCIPYNMGYHTGVDLNLNYPSYNSDKGKTVFAASAGTVIHAAYYGNLTWGGVVILRHKPLNPPHNTPIYSRYVHLLPDLVVSVGEDVPRGCPLGAIGNMPGYVEGWQHLHFDMPCFTGIEIDPLNWPGGGEAGKKLVQANYLDPLPFIREHRVGVGTLPPCPGVGE
jgi:murein DD-endopeptidase MepM/ murein hydrolase activator NlpD